MDMMSIYDLLLECLRALVMVALLATLFLRGRTATLSRHPGWNQILAGFILITLANLLDLTDEFPVMERFVIFGDTIYEAFLEKLPGYLLGFVLVLVGFYRMIPSLQNAERNERALQDSEERFRQIFVANPDPVILARLESGAVIDVNPAFEAQTGYSRASVLGKNSAELGIWANPGKRDEFRSALIQHGVVDNMEADFRLGGDRVRPGLLSARIVAISGETCILIVIRDITRIKEAEKALLEVDKIRSEFISTAAHELRTPLSVLIGYTELLNDPEIFSKFSDEKRREFLAEIEKKGLVLSQIVDDLLDVSRMDAGMKLNLHYTRFRPNDVLRQAFRQFQVHSPDHRFCIDLQDGSEIDMEGDEKRILQALENLLSNAVKYSRDGSHVTLSGRDAGDMYAMTVQDAGIGMTAEQVDRIFEKFYRADASNTAVGGLGLGMGIVKQIVDAHGGSIAIDSSPGEGTRITISLPKERPSLDDQAAAAAV